MTKKIETLTGVALADLPARLDVEFPKEAYKEIPSAKYLTDIDPNYMRNLLNELFGLCGFGWGYAYSPDSFTLSQQDTVTSQGKKRSLWFAQVFKLTFWYKLVVDGEVITYEVPATGASDNKVAAYALKGALTAAIGNAVSNLGFQKSVYMGERDHKSVRAKKPKTTAAKQATTKAKPKAAKTKPKAKPPADVEDFVIPTGPKAGQKLADVDLKAITFYAKKTKTQGDPDKEALQEAAQSILAVRSNGHKPAFAA